MLEKVIHLIDEKSLFSLQQIQRFYLAGLQVTQYLNMRLIHGRKVIFNDRVEQEKIIFAASVELRVMLYSFQNSELFELE